MKAPDLWRLYYVIFSLSTESACLVQRQWYGSLYLKRGLAFMKAMRAFIALASLTLLVGLILLGLFDRSPPPQAAVVARSGTVSFYTDIELYQDIVTDMRNGTGYYEAAVGEARKHDYPLRPFVTVRLPTVAWLLSAMPSNVFGLVCLIALAFATLCAWCWRLRDMHLTRPQYAIAMICLTSGLYPAMFPLFVLFHETWAGVLIALSLAVRRKDAWVTSVLVGLAAALTRELAGAYLLAMAAMAIKDRNYREAGAWIAAVAVLAIALAIHAMNVNALVTPHDFASPGWLAHGGWASVLNTAHWNNVFLWSTPQWMSVIVVSLALFGLTAPQIDRRLLLVIGGYVTTFFVVGRSDNFYWGLLIAPLWPIGLAGVWPALVARLSEIQAAFRVQQAVDLATKEQRAGFMNL